MTAFQDTEDFKAGFADEAEFECDCCGKLAPLSRCFTPCGTETFACEECRS